MNFDEKLQIASFFSILIGFALIIWEFQQSRAMTAAVLASDGAIHRAETDLKIAEFAGTYARACQDPQAITVKDSIVLSQIYRAFYESRVNRIRNYEQALDTGVDRRPGINTWFRFMFETEFGRRHWKRIGQYYEPEIKQTGDEILKSMGPPYCFAAGGIMPLEHQIIRREPSY